MKVAQFKQIDLPRLIQWMVHTLGRIRLTQKALPCLDILLSTLARYLFVIHDLAYGWYSCRDKTKSSNGATIHIHP